MLCIGVLSLALMVTARSALRGGGTSLFILSSFAWCVAAYFGLLVSWLGVDRVFSGASLEGLGVLVLLAASAGAAAVTTAVTTTAIHRWAKAAR